jgi:dTDP-4-amino-4,6-dideoxygalactose transaminase
MLRKQLPVYSPLTPSSILAGWRALAANDSNATAAIRHLIGEKYGTEHILLTDSGTSALTLAIKAYCRIRSTPLVALPAYCCYDIATAADGADVEVILYDIDARTLSPDIQSLSNALSRRPGAIVVAHLYGVPIEVQDIIRLCEQHQVPVIEDAAQGHGAQYDGLPLGSFGDVSILSFGRGKGVTGGGGGALLAVSDGTSHVIEEAAQETGSSHRGLKPLIGATAQWLLASPTMYAIPASLPFLRLGQTIYREPTSPMGITHSAAGALARNWVISEAESVTRRINADRISKNVADSDYADLFETPAQSTPGYLRLPVIALGGEGSPLATRQARSLGVMPGYPTTLADLPRFTQRCRNRAEDITGARTLAAQLFTLPTHSRLSPSDMDRLNSLLNGTATS